MKFKVVFHYSKEYDYQPWWTALKGLAEQKLMKAWHRHCDYSNPKLEAWNAEFDELYPGLDGLSEEYTNFIKEKYAPIYDELNSEGNAGDPIQFSYHSGNELEMIETCKINGVKLFEVYFTLKEVP